ncbi:MAG: 2Fe-2S iron-sulfur cluster binding domain-containing protein [Alphaproteobacteria bacterium]|nr:2Fe-2S iron-sulfur cluster binding domain-containing protein [Alphaproteobacteria bacterium]
MPTISITITDAAGNTRTIADVTTGITLMEVSRQNGVEGVLGNCGGGAACGTCHVYVDAEWVDRLPAPDSIETDMLDLLEDMRRENSRLGCQIRLAASLKGLNVTVAPPSD